MKKILLLFIISILNTNIFSHKPNILVFKSISDLLNATYLVTEYMLNSAKRLEFDDDVKDILYTAYWFQKNDGVNMYTGKQDKLLKIPHELIIKLIEQISAKNPIEMLKIFLDITKRVGLDIKAQEEVILSKNRKQAYKVYIPKEGIYTYQKELAMIEDFLIYIASLVNKKELIIDIPQLLKATASNFDKIRNIADYITIWNGLSYNLNKDSDITLSKENIGNILSLINVFKDPIIKGYIKDYSKKVDEFANLCKSLNIPTQLVLPRELLYKFNNK